MNLIAVSPSTPPGAVELVFAALVFGYTAWWIFISQARGIIGPWIMPACQLVLGALYFFYRCGVQGVVLYMAAVHLIEFAVEMRKRIRPHRRVIVRHIAWFLLRLNWDFRFRTTRRPQDPPPRPLPAKAAESRPPETESPN